MRINESAGGVVLNDRGEVIVVSQKGDSWSLPKGHLDPGEDALGAAKREIAEEAGVTDLEYVDDLGSYERYRIGKGGVEEDTSDLKRIRMFLFRTRQDALSPTDPENPEARWVPIAEVAAMLTHPKDREFFERVAGKLQLN